LAQIRTSLGRTFSLDGTSWQIVAVLPPGFAFPNQDVEIWTLWTCRDSPTARDQRFLQVLARLKPGVSLEQAQSSLAATARTLADQFSKSERGLGCKACSFT